MRPNLCWSCLASILKLLNFLQAFVGVSIIVYSAWILNHLMRNKIGNGFSFDFDKLPAPWFVCVLMGIGMLVCLIAFTGHVAAEAYNSCCLRFYAIFLMMLILLEAVLVGDLVLNKRWEEDLPNDTTGELKRLRTFIEDNIDECEWIGVTVIVIQVVSLLLAMSLRAMIPRRKLEYDDEEDFIVIRRPLLNPQSSPKYINIPATVDGQGHHSDIWSSRMRQKYGLNQN